MIPYITKCMPYETKRLLSLVMYHWNVGHTKCVKIISLEVEHGIVNYNDNNNSLYFQRVTHLAIKR